MSSKKSKPKPKSNSNSLRLINLEDIPECLRFSLCLDRGKNFYDEFQCLMWELRIFFSLGCKKLQWKPISNKSNALFLVELSYHQNFAQLILEKQNLDLVAISSKGQWILGMESLFTIPQARTVDFNVKLREKYIFEVGEDVLRRCVLSLHNGRSNEWLDCFLKLQLNISVAARLPLIHKCILKANTSLDRFTPRVLVLSHFEKWVVTNEETLEKIWKIWCRFEVWDPLNTICQEFKIEGSDMLENHSAGGKVIDILQDVSIGDEIIKMKRLGYNDKDPDIK